ncbi:hypothetical protein TrVE_jg2587, partial [Triparma verrucosa]
MYSSLPRPLSPPPTSREELESLLFDCKVLKRLLKKYKKKRRGATQDFLKFTSAPGEARVDWLLELYGESFGRDHLDYYVGDGYFDDDNGDGDDNPNIVSTLEEANERWMSAYETIYSVKMEKTAKFMSEQRLQMEEAANRPAQENLTGVAKVFCDDNSQPDVWKKVLLFCGFDTMKNLREVSSSFHRKVDKTVVRDYFEVVTRKIGGLEEVTELVENSISHAPVVLPWGKGMLIEQWKKDDPLWKYLCKGWGISTKLILEESNKQRRGFNVKPIAEAVAGIGVILFDPDWHEQTLMDKYEIYTKVEHEIWNVTGGRAGRERTVAKMTVVAKEKFAKKRESMFLLLLKSTEMTYASVVFKLLTPEKRLVYENTRELLTNWREVHGNLHICKELRSASSKIYEAYFRLICNVMDAANSVEEFMSAHDGRYEGLKEVIYKEGHRQARTHLEHHQLLNLMNLLEKEQGAVKSFKKWFARAKKKEALFALKEERRKQLYSQERSRGASGEGFR